ncbi:hypothetical protein SDC9_135252 [bioreactor metagenome]|uniref:Uncharacterized protein n=1 Tax=bioreactor metagenome TaxID=1076179 RepID=A0A645DFY1_9ZZZZ
MHLKQAAETFAAAGARIVDFHPLTGGAAVDAEVVKLADKRVGHNLENQRREGLIIAHVPGLGFSGDRIGPIDVPDVDRAGQIVHDDVQQRLNPAFLERRGTGHRHERRGNGSPTQCLFELVVGRLFVGQEKLHDFVVDFRQALDHVPVIFLVKFLIFRRNFLHTHHRAVFIAVEVNRPCFQYVDHAGEFGFLADRQHQRHRSGAEFGPDFFDRAVEVGAGTVHLVDQRHDRHFVFLRLTPDRFGLGLDLAYRTENRNRAIKHTQRTLHFRREVHVSGSVDQIDAMLFVVAVPETGGGGTGDGNPAFAFLLHPVHGGGAFMHFAQLVIDAAVKKDAFRQRGLAGVDVSHDPDIADIGQSNLAVGGFFELFIVAHHSSLWK